MTGCQAFDYQYLYVKKSLSKSIGKNSEKVTDKLYTQKLLKAMDKVPEKFDCHNAIDYYRYKSVR